MPCLDNQNSLKRRLDDRIDELCEKVSRAQLREKELQAMSQELLRLWREKMNHIRKLGAAHLAGEEVPKDRRADES